MNRLKPCFPSAPATLARAARGRTDTAALAAAALVALGVLVLAAAFFTAPPALPDPDRSPEAFARFVADEGPDPCQPPPGYTKEAWQQHMSHHPDRYAACLNEGAEGGAP